MIIKNEKYQSTTDLEQIKVLGTEKFWLINEKKLVKWITFLGKLAFTEETQSRLANQKEMKKEKSGEQLSSSNIWAQTIVQMGFNFKKNVPTTFNQLPNLEMEGKFPFPFIKVLYT